VAKADEGLPLPGLGTRTAGSKFLEAVKNAAEENHFELVVDPDGPNAGYGYIQKRDSFSNFFAFRFEFGDTFAVFYMGTDSVQAAANA
jgi:hypothetical protein